MNQRKKDRLALRVPFVPCVRGRFCINAAAAQDAREGAVGRCGSETLNENHFVMMGVMYESSDNPSDACRLV